MLITSHGTIRYIKYMNKYFLFSDIHGRKLDELKIRLKESHFNKDDPYNIYFGKDTICLDSPYYINILVINEDNSFSFNNFNEKE